MQYFKPFILSVLLLLLGPAWAQQMLQLPPGDIVHRDLGRQKEVLIQIEEMLRLMDIVSGYPPSVINVLMDSTRDNPSRLRSALGMLHTSREEAQTVLAAELTEVVPEPEPEPVKLASKHLVFISLPDAHNPGVASLLIRGKGYSLTIGEDITIDRKQYTLQHIYRDETGQIVVVFEQGNRSIPLNWRTG